MTNKISKTTFGILSVIALSLVLGACGAGKNKTNVEIFQGMFDQEAMKFQDWDPDSKDSFTMRVPPENTVPRGFKPYKYGLDFMAAEKGLINPIKKDFSAKTMERAKEHYQVYCGLCHGQDGKGDGQIAQHMILKPPALISDKAKAFNDGRIFHIITKGQGIMGSYSRQIIKETDRWAVVNYIRTLQRKAN
ncbi:MAG: cytochrome c [Bdellovibrionaceae bacterium]|jgi:mono/diheme cytochrome c family protein|nr:cytochrome c [Pseudobdellovibrionaceae bacterium]